MENELIIDDMSIQSDIEIQEMEPEDPSKETEKEESWISIDRDNKPKKSKFQLFRMGMVYFGIELIFSIEIALTVPILLKLNVSESIYSYVYFLSPLLGFLLQPILGLLSDRCQSPLGRRRPFILTLSIFAFIGISLILNGSLIGELMGDSETEIGVRGIIIVGIGVTLLDFSADSCDSPLRAFLLDVCNAKDQNTGLNIHAFLGGVGASIGYILTAIDWSFLTNPIFEEEQIMWIISGVIFIICVVSTMTSAKEFRYKFYRNKISVVKENEDFALKISKNSLEITHKKKQENSSNNEIVHENLNVIRARAFTDISIKLDATENNDSNDESPVSVKVLFKSFKNMPKELKRLLIGQLAGWLALFSNTLFFTDFVAQSIYKGDPYADTNTTAYKLYNSGTKMGSWCLLSFSVSSALSAIIIENILLKKFSTKFLYLATYLLYVLSCVAIFFLDNVFIIIPFCFSFGILMTTLTTLPYQMLSEFHQEESYVNSSKNGVKRGMGIDCSLLSSCFFLGQLIVSSFMSLLTANFDNRVILIVAGIFGTLGFFFILFFVIFPKRNASNQ